MLFTTSSVKDNDSYWENLVDNGAGNLADGDPHDDAAAHALAIVATAVPAQVQARIRLVDYQNSIDCHEACATCQYKT